MRMRMGMQRQQEGVDVGVMGDDDGWFSLQSDIPVSRSVTPEVKSYFLSRGW